MFGFKHELSGKQGVDCLVCVPFSSLPSNKQGRKLFRARVERFKMEQVCSTSGAEWIVCVLC